MPLAAWLTLGCATSVLGCSEGPADATHTPDRGPLGKADRAGSCEDACGGPSEGGTCWCDDSCTSHGDCCDDHGAVCLGEPAGCSDVSSTIVSTFRGDFPASTTHGWLSADGKVLRLHATTQDGSLQERGALTLPGTIMGIAASGERAVVRASGGGQHLYFVTVPAVGDPVLVGSATESMPSAGALAIDDSVAAAGGVDGRVTLWPVADAMPEPLAVLATPGMVLDLALQDGRLFVANANAGLQSYDVSDPAAPSLVGGVPLGSTEGGYRILVPAGDVLYALRERGRYDLQRDVTTIDISGVPTVAGHVTLQTRFSSYWPTTATMAANGDTLFVGDEPPQLALAPPTTSRRTMVLGLQDPLAPTRLGWIRVAESAKDIAADGTSLVHVSTISGNPSIDVVPVARALELMSEVPGVTDVRAVASAGELLYVVDSTFGLRILEADGVTPPTQLGGIAVKSPYGVLVHEDVAMVRGSGGVAVVDVADPGHPTLRGTLSSTGQDVEFSHDRAYVAGFKVVDIVDLDHDGGPTRVGRIDESESVFGLAVQEDILFVATFKYLATYSLVQPDAPVLLARMTGVDARSVAVRGDRAYVTQTGGRLTIVDVADPAKPAVLGKIGGISGGSTIASAIDGDRLIVTHGDEATVIDVSEPDLPAVVMRVVTPKTIGSAAVLGSHLFAAGGSLLAVPLCGD